MPALPRRRRARRADLRAVERPALDRQLGDLIDEHTDAVFRLAFGILHDRQLTEDVVQETMMRAWTSLGGFRGDASERTWVLRIAHNTAIEHNTFFITQHSNAKGGKTAGAPQGANGRNRILGASQAKRQAAEKVTG